MTERVQETVAELARNLYERLSARDLAGYFELLADDAVFHVGGDSRVSARPTSRCSRRGPRGRAKNASRSVAARAAERRR